MLFQNADDLIFGEPAALHLWSFRLGQSLSQNGLGGGGNVTTNHHFLTPTDIKGFDFAAGDYELEVFAKIIGKDMTLLLSTIRLSIDVHEAGQLRKADHGIYFDWGPDAGRYQKKIEGRRSKALDPLKMLEALQDGGALTSPKS